MQGGKLDLAKEGVDLAVARLRDADRAALVVYDDEVDTVQPLAPATPRLKASLTRPARRRSRGSTYLSGGWIAGCHQLAEATPAAPGGLHGNAHPARHPAHRWVGKRRHSRPRGSGGTPGSCGGAASPRPPSVSGQDFDEHCSARWRKRVVGNSQYVAGPDGLRAFFAHELQELFSVSATGLAVTLGCPIRASTPSSSPRSRSNPRRCTRRGHRRPPRATRSIAYSPFELGPASPVTFAASQRYRLLADPPATTCAGDRRQAGPAPARGGRGGGSGCVR